MYAVCACMQQEVLLHLRLILSSTGRPVNVCRVNEKTIIYDDASDPICPASCLLIYTCIVLAGVAVATAYCAIESLAITLPTEWTFGVTDTGSCYVPNLSALYILLLLLL